MSVSHKIPRIGGLVIAFWVEKAIRDLVSHASMVGSLRRESPEIGDVDILVEVAPPVEENLAKIKGRLLTQSTWKRGGKRMMVFENVLDTGIQLDLFLCHPPKNFWALLALRTGPDEDTIRLREGLLANGFPRPHSEIRVGSERELYYLAGLEWREPTER